MKRNSDQLKSVIKIIADYEAKIAALESRIAAMSVVGVHAVLPGDVWYYPENRRLGFAKSSWLNTVKSVNKRKNEVHFTDGGWNPLDNMLDENGGWYLLGRTYKPGMEDDVKV